MKKKFVSILLCGIMILGLTGCKNNKQMVETTNLKNKNYTLKKLNLDCNLDNITFVNKKYIISNGRIYTYSSKKFSETDTKCKLLSTDEKTYKFLGYIPENVYSFDTFIDNNNQIVKIYNNEIKSFYNIEDIISKYMNNDFYYHNMRTEVTDTYWSFFYNQNDRKIEIPKDEKVLYYVKNQWPDTIITDKGAYTIGVDKNDKCHEYEDIDCTYKLQKTEKYNELLNDYKDNISYFDGEYLITTENIIYKVSFVVLKQTMK